MKTNQILEGTFEGIIPLCFFFNLYPNFCASVYAFSTCSVSSHIFHSAVAILSSPRYIDSQRRKSGGMANGYSCFGLESSLSERGLPSQVYVHQRLPNWLVFSCPTADQWVLSV